MPTKEYDLELLELIVTFEETGEELFKIDYRKEE
jgi:hypothetical protein